MALVNKLLFLKDENEVSVKKNNETLGLIDDEVVSSVIILNDEESLSTREWTNE